MLKFIYSLMLIKTCIAFASNLRTNGFATLWIYTCHPILRNPNGEIESAFTAFSIFISGNSWKIPTRREKVGKTKKACRTSNVIFFYKNKLWFSKLVLTVLPVVYGQSWKFKYLPWNFNPTYLSKNLKVRLWRQMFKF